MNCDRCGKEFPIEALSMIACEGVFCEPCEITLLERACGIESYEDQIESNCEAGHCYE